MDLWYLPLVLSFALLVGLWAGAALADRKWRERGDHDHLNRIESAGRLYIVRREGK